jgi:hypothetical protein
MIYHVHFNTGAQLQVSKKMAWACSERKNVSHVNSKTCRSELKIEEGKKRQARA